MDAATPLPERQVSRKPLAAAHVADDRGALRWCQSDPVFRVLVSRWGLRERGVALLTMLLGFGVLATWYFAGLAFDPAARGRRGPFEYYSGSLGDLVLIPLLNAAAVRYVRLIPGGLQLAVAAGRRCARPLLTLIERAYNAPRGRTFALGVMAVAAALQHVDELYGVDRNWTVPEWGRLRPVAFYHQAFFACEVFIVAFLVVRHVITARLLLRLGRDGTGRARLAPVAEQSLRIFGWVLLGWGSFASLRVMDFFYLAPTVAASALTAFPAVVVVLVVYYVLLLLTGVVPLLAVTLRYRLGWTSASMLLTGIAFIAPIAGPAARILVAQLLAV
jgi:hypothetical protein